MHLYTKDKYLETLIRQAAQKLCPDDQHSAGDGVGPVVQRAHAAWLEPGWFGHVGTSLRKNGSCRRASGRLSEANIVGLTPQRSPTSPTSVCSMSPPDLRPRFDVRRWKIPGVELRGKRHADLTTPSSTAGCWFLTESNKLKLQHSRSSAQGQQDITRFIALNPNPACRSSPKRATLHQQSDKPRMFIPASGRKPDASQAGGSVKLPGINLKGSEIVMWSVSCGASGCDCNELPALLAATGVHAALLMN